MLRDFIRQKRTEITSKRPDFSRIKTRVNETAEAAEETRGAKKTGAGKEKAAGKMQAVAALPEVPDNCYRKCNFCGKAILNMDVQKNLYRCPKCGGYFRVHAYRRIEMLADAGSFSEINKTMPFVNPLSFPGYENKVQVMREKYGLDEAVVTGTCRIGGEEAVLCVCDGRFIMSSMGHNVGEKITQAVELATEKKLPVIIYCCSGGARMQEGIVSLMQMAKTSAALKRHHDAGLLYVSVLTNPTTGGVTASFAMLGDVILAEPEALIGFAGPRVIEQTIRQKLPEGFQRSEFLLAHGFVDEIVRREDQKTVLAQLIRSHDKKRIGQAAKAFAALAEESLKTEAAEKTVSAGADKNSAVTAEAAGEEKTRAERADHSAFAAENAAKKRAESGKPGEKASAWDKVQLSRSADRPKALDYIQHIFENFMELHGDRAFGDDGAVVGGLAEFCGMPVTVIAEQKGKNMKDNLKRNFGMPSPEGYRKALRLMKQANDFGRPIICFVDTPGAYPGMESEERGQGEAIARCLYELSGVTVPVLSIVISEGGSGGALALAVANEVFMLENAVYSILSPEGFASILYKDAKKAKEASEIMKITAEELYELSVIDRIIPEAEAASAENVETLSEEISREMKAFFARTAGKSAETLQSERYAKFRNL